MLRFSCKLSSVLGMIFMVGGCYSFAPAEPESVSPGETVRARISRGEATRLAGILGRTDPILEGTIVERGSEGLMLDVTVATRQVGFHFEPMGQRVQLGLGEILEMDRKELNRWRTGGLLTVLGTAVGFVAWQAFSGDSGGSSTDRPGGGVSDAKILTIGFRVR